MEALLLHAYVFRMTVCARPHLLTYSPALVDHVSAILVNVADNS